MRLNKGIYYAVVYSYPEYFAYLWQMLPITKPYRPSPMELYDLYTRTVYVGFVGCMGLAI